MNANILLLKSNSLAFEKEKLLLHTQTMLHEIEKRALMQEPFCMIPIMPAYLLVKKSLVWWKQNACHGEQYYYVTEYLGTNPCAIVGTNENNQAIHAKYFRITLLDLSAKLPDEKIILQSVIATKNTETLSCTDQLYKAKLGEQMQRELV